MREHTEYIPSYYEIVCVHVNEYEIRGVYSSTSVYPCVHVHPSPGPCLLLIFSSPVFHFLMFHLLLQLFRPSRQRGHHTGHVHGNGVFLRARVQNGHQLTQQTVRLRQRWTDLDHVGRIFALHGVPLGPCLANIKPKKRKEPLVVVILVIACTHMA